MPMGLIIRDGQGRVILDPSTFTVRLVAEIEVRRGNMAPGSSIRIPVAGVKAGMFGQVSPLRAYPSGQNLYGSRLYPNGFIYDTSRVDNLQCVPYVNVGNGYIDLVAYSLAGSVAIADVVVYVLTNS